ncbi:MAG: nitronate monooxygenase [Chloroflexi bacterium]|nr:nitronate monooxygenase [Chloroflexota bacterium]
MFQTRVTEMLGIKYPIIQGGMQWLGVAELAAAVSEAGALGMINAGNFQDPEGFRDELRKAKQLTDKPLGVNVTLMPTIRPVNTSAFVNVLIEEGVKAVETSGRSPEEFLPQFKAAGVKVIHKVPAVRFARHVEHAGVDAVTVVGFECGGHPGMDDVTSLILLPLASQSVTIPVVAGGGFGDARGFVAALSLGAEAVLMGTRFMATEECPAHPSFKHWLIDLSERDTVLLERSIRNTGRFARNQAAETVLKLEDEGASLEELLPHISGLKSRTVLMEGDLDAGVVSCGQVVGLIKEIKPVKQVIEDIVQGARDICERLHLQSLAAAPASRRL